MKSQLHLKWEGLPDGRTRKERDAKQDALHKPAFFSAQAFVGDRDLHPTAREAALSIQCDSPEGFEGSRLTKLCCAAELCVQCPDFQRPEFELTANDSIKFFASNLSPLAASVAHWKLMPESVLSA